MSAPVRAPAAPRGRAARLRERLRSGEQALPGSGEVARELARARARASLARSCARAAAGALVAAAAAVLACALWLPVVAVEGSSMEPALSDGDVVVALRGAQVSAGDVVAYWSGGDLLLGRVVAEAGQTVDLGEGGEVYVDGVELDEPYVEDAALGEVGVGLPCEVPEGCVFVLADARSSGAADSRSAGVGCVSLERVLGRVLFRVWPPWRLGAA